MCPTGEKAARRADPGSEKVVESSVTSTQGTAGGQGHAVQESSANAQETGVHQSDLSAVQESIVQGQTVQTSCAHGTNVQNSSVQDSSVQTASLQTVQTQKQCIQSPIMQTTVPVSTVDVQTSDVPPSHVQIPPELGDQSVRDEFTKGTASSVGSEENAAVSAGLTHQPPCNSSANKYLIPDMQIHLEQVFVFIFLLYGGNQIKAE